MLHKLFTVKLDRRPAPKNVSRLNLLFDSEDPAAFHAKRNAAIEYRDGVIKNLR